MKKILKVLVDLVYLVPVKVNKFKTEYPNEVILAYGGSKGIELQSEEDVKRGVNWALSKRSIFVLSDKRILMGDWNINIEEIEKAELQEYRSGMVLKITLKNHLHYQFGLQYNSELLNQNELPLDIIESKVKYSAFSITFRGIIIGALVYELFLKNLF